MERDRKAAAALKTNVGMLEAGQRSHVLQMSAERFLATSIRQPSI